MPHSSSPCPSSPPRKNAPIHHKMIVAFDFSELAVRAIHQGLSFANAVGCTELHVLCVGAPQGELIRLPGNIEPITHAEASERVRADVARIVEEHETNGGPACVERIAVYATAGHPSEQIVALAEALEADAIILGTHSRTGLSRLILGSVAEAVVRRAPCGVFVIRPRDFLKGERVPEIEPPLKPGEHALKPFRHVPAYHYVSRVTQQTQRILPIT